MLYENKVNSFSVQLKVELGLQVREEFAKIQNCDCLELLTLGLDLALQILEIFINACCRNSHAHTEVAH